MGERFELSKIFNHNKNLLSIESCCECLFGAIYESRTRDSTLARSRFTTKLRLHWGIAFEVNAELHISFLLLSEDIICS